jgi:hypothetical protein
MAQTSAADDEEQSATVSEIQFSGSAVVSVEISSDYTEGDAGAPKRQMVKDVAQDYFACTHGSWPAQTVAEKDGAQLRDTDTETWTVMMSSEYRAPESNCAPKTYNI